MDDLPGQMTVEDKSLQPYVTRCFISGQLGLMPHLIFYAMAGPACP